ncbi:MAG: hypothetical protein IGS03_07975 [Candidatus Sericytochromatia bacterium]|nr:hypothetical protein [Candidatus Sericytochromatia bacterium]
MRGPQWRIEVAAWQGLLLASVNGQALGLCEAARQQAAHSRWGLYLYGIPDNSPARVTAIQLHSL